MPSPLELTALPVELVDNIVANTDSHELLCFSQTSKSLNSICVRRIYASIILNDGLRAVRCLKTLASNTTAACCVRKVIDALKIEGYTVLRGLSHLLRAAMHNLRFLVELSVHQSLNILPMISAIVFPHLRMCFIPLASLQHGIQFLQLHPNLEVASLYGPAPDTDAFSQITLKKLAHVAGPQSAAEKILPNTRCLESISILWDPSPESSFSSFLTVVPKANLRNMGHIVWHWDATLLRAISAHVPDLTSLSIHNRGQEHNPKYFEEFVSHVGEALHSLQGLRTLQFSASSAHPFRLDDLSAQFALVSQSSLRAPSVQCCIFLDFTRWVSIGGVPRAWFPLSEEGHREHAVDRARWVITHIAQKLASLPSQYGSVIQDWLGNKEFEKLQRGEHIFSDEEEDGDSDAEIAESWD